MTRSEALPVALLPLAQARQLLPGALRLLRILLRCRPQLLQLRLQVASLPRVRFFHAFQLMLRLLQLSLQAGTAHAVMRPSEGLLI